MCMAWPDSSSGRDEPAAVGLELRRSAVMPGPDSIVATTAKTAAPATHATKAKHDEKAKPGEPRKQSFKEFVASVWPKAKERGVSRETFDAAFKGVTYRPAIVANANRQPEFVRPIWDYVASAVSKDRVERGRDHAEKNNAWLEKANKTFGVDPSAVMGIWGLETDFGRFTGSDNIVAALASLAYARFRGDYFLDELVAALVILEEGDVAPKEMRGSWAGAMGQTQFMPSSYLSYAVDFDGSGRRDIWKNEADAIGSTANFLVAHGWKPGLPWGFEIRLPEGFALTDADSSRSAPFSAFSARGVKRADGAALPEKGEGRLFLPAGLKGPIFLVTTNFDVIKSYNPSTAYALSVALLGDAIAGNPGLAAEWPVKDRALSMAQVRKLQGDLKRMGYSVGDIDGMVGEALRSAVRAYQQRNGLTPDGYPDLALLKRVTREKPSR